jgi:hypothetical protein
MAEPGDALTKTYELDKPRYQLATQQLGCTNEEWEHIKRPPPIPVGVCHHRHHDRDVTPSTLIDGGRLPSSYSYA